MGKRDVVLPPEVWICIFRHATHVPGTLIPDIYAHAHLVGPDYNRVFHPRLQEALVTKRSLVRVCKQWWHLAKPFLYQSVFIDRTCCLSSLSKTLADSAAGKGTIVGSKPFGIYTQRIDITVAMDADSEFPEFLATIINSMPNLAIVSFATMVWSELPTHVQRALCDIAPMVCVLDLSSSGLETSLQLTGLLKLCTHLRVLHCPRLFWLVDLDPGYIPPTVTTLRVHNILLLSPFDDIPYFLPDTTRPPEPSALQELILTINWSFPDSENLLRTYGSQLVSVQFYIPSSSSWTSMRTDMELLAQTCPTLRRFTITLDNLDTFIRPNITFPPITYLGLRAARPRLTRKVFKMLFTFREELRSRLPSLRVLQLLDEHSLGCLFKDKFAARALQPIMRASPVRIEDQEGVLLTDRLRARRCL